MKRLMLLLLSAILAASCFSCAANTEEEKETGTPSTPVSAETTPETAETAPGEEERIAGPSMDKKQAAAYQKGLKKRAKKGGWQDYLFGRFK